MTSKSLSSEWYTEETRSGQPTAILNGRAVHSRFNPIREAETAVDAIQGDEIGIIVLAGFGLGYVAESIVKKFPGTRLIVADAEENALSRAGNIRNLDNLLSENKITFFLGANPVEIKNLLTGGTVGAGILYFPWRPAMHVNPDWYASLERHVSVTAHHKKINAHTLDKFGRLWVKNLAFNRFILARAISLEHGRDVFSDMPALVLAGGPSLEDILPHLKQLARRFLIISVDTALRAALRVGVVPDVLVTVDPQYWNTRHLDWCGSEVRNVLLVSETTVHHKVFRTMDCSCMLLRTRFPLGTIFENAVGLKGELKTGGSVATAAWDLARYFGCSSIVAAGLDLGFPNFKTHYTGSLSHELPHFDSTRLSPAQHTFHRMLKDAHPYIVKDMAGRALITNARMDVYHTWFSDSVKIAAGRNPSVLGDKGRFIKGMGIVNIEKLMEVKENRNELNKRMDKLKQISPSPDARESLEKISIRLVEALRYIIQLARQGIKETNSAKALQKNINNHEKFAEYQNHLKKLAIIDRELMNGEGLEIVSFLLQPVILSITSYNSSQKRDPLDGSIYLYNEILNSTNLHLELLKYHD